MAPSGLVIHAAVASAHTGKAVCTTPSPDTDGDHVADCWESSNGLKVGIRDGKTDRDHDGLRANQEFSLDVRTAGNGLFSPYHANLDASDGHGREEGERH